jgi:hypothetical protein
MYRHPKPSHQCSHSRPAKLFSEESLAQTRVVPPLLTKRTHSNYLRGFWSTFKEMNSRRTCNLSRKPASIRMSDGKDLKSNLREIKPFFHRIFRKFIFLSINLFKMNHFIFIVNEQKFSSISENEFVLISTAL